MPDVNKFTYLKSLLEGEAKEAIEGFPLTGQNYEKARKLLSDRFGRRERIIFKHVQELLGMASLGKQSSLTGLQKLQDGLLSHVRSLETLGIAGSQYGVLLTPIILSSLPADIRMQWARASERRERDLEWLLEFLGQEIKFREKSHTFRNLSKSQEDRQPEQRRSRSTATALPSSSCQIRSCAICAKAHPTERCWDLVLPREWREKIRKHGLCFRCLGKGHLANSCEKVCSRCQGSHCFLLCRENGSGPKKMNSEAEKTEKEKDCQEAVIFPGVVTLSAKPPVVNIIMQVAQVEVMGKEGPVKATVLFDTGSDRTYVSSKLVRQVDPEFVSSEMVQYAAFGAVKANRAELKNLYRLEFRGSSDVEAVVATEIPVICAPLYRRSVPKNLIQSFGTIKLVDNYEEAREVTVDLLVGLDNYWKLVKPGAICIPEGLVAQETAFGWVISGKLEGGEVSKPSHQLLCLCELPDVVVQNFSDLDTAGEVQGENPVLKEFQSKWQMRENRYEVGLPWKPDKAEDLMDNCKMACTRLQSLEKRLDRDLVLKERYNVALKEMEDTGVIEEVPTDQLSGEGPTFYLPHRPVIREASSSTKVRPVFDASAKGPNNVSLNDCLEVGPNLIPSLVDILVRFRRWPVAVVADIKKAFLQISVRTEDQGVLRFLWEQDGIIRGMRIVRIPFGCCSSPFILNVVIQHHLDKFESTRVIEELQENLYVDDWLTGAEDELEAKAMIKEASQVMNQASMFLTKWESNKSVVVDKAESSDFVKVLGIVWRAKEDDFSFEGLEVVTCASPNV